VLPDKDLRRSARAGRSFAVNLHFHDIAAPNDGNIAKPLHSGKGEFEAEELTTFGVKFSSRSKDIGLILSFFLAATHYNGPMRNQSLQCLCIAGKLCAPNRLTRLETLIVRCGCARQCDQQSRQNDDYGANSDCPKHFLPPKQLK
jgi:hypothetical protein